MESRSGGIRAGFSAASRVGYYSWDGVNFRVAYSLDLTRPISDLFGVKAIYHTFTIDRYGVLHEEHVSDASIRRQAQENFYPRYRPLARNRPRRSLGVL